MSGDQIAVLGQSLRVFLEPKYTVTCRNRSRENRRTMSSSSQRRSTHEPELLAVVALRAIAKELADRPDVLREAAEHLRAERIRIDAHRTGRTEPSSHEHRKAA